MAYFGVQYLSESLPNGVDKMLKSIASAFGSDKGPGHWDRALYVDEAGFTNIISMGRAGRVRCVVRELRCQLDQRCRCRKHCLMIRAAAWYFVGASHRT